VTARQLEVGEQLGFVDGLKLGHRLERNDDPMFNEQVDAIAAPIICSVTSFSLISAPSAFSAVIRYRTCETQH
jgi:hypothetical protein